MAELDLSLVPLKLHAQARHYFEAGNAKEFYYAVIRECEGGSADNGPDIVRANIDALINRGIYEEVLILAFTGCNRRIPLPVVAELFGRADRDRLRNSGEPLPGQGPWTVYRGIAGDGEGRNTGGFSWTDSLNQACWFAIRGHYSEPEILTATVRIEDVLFYYRDFDEGEFVCNPEHPTKLDISGDEIERRGLEAERKRVEDDRRWYGDESR